MLANATFFAGGCSTCSPIKRLTLLGLLAGRLREYEAMVHIDGLIVGGNAGEGRLEEGMLIEE